MSKLYFKYGTMNCGKSLSLITTAHSYEKQGREVLICTSKIDTRSKKSYVESRIGAKRKALSLSDTPDKMWSELSSCCSRNNYSVILIDEAQFFSSEQIELLSNFVDEKQIPIICYGLKNDFMNKLFEGSATLLAYADKIEELKTICSFCEKKATMNLRVIDGVAEYEGKQILCGDSEYFPVCRTCYKDNPFS